MLFFNLFSIFFCIKCAIYLAPFTSHGVEVAKPHVSNIHLASKGYVYVQSCLTAFGETFVG